MTPGSPQGTASQNAAPHSSVPWVEEGKATFAVGGAFYRSKSAIARDLAVLAAAVYRQRQGHLRVLDAMTGCGVRPLRYGLEAEADFVWANLAAVPAGPSRLTHGDANQIFFTCYQGRDFYDLVDIDNFGSPAPHVENGLWATQIGGMLYLTSTDGRSTGGHDPERSLRTYGAWARSHPAVHEQGLRLMIGHAAQTAAARGLGVEPVFSLFTGQVHRVMVRLVSKPTLNAGNYGFLGYCHGCGHFQTVGWRQLGKVGCPCRAGDTPVVSGPMWLGPLHDGETLAAMVRLADDWGWLPQGRLLAMMAKEIDLPPYYYPLGEIGRRGQIDSPNRERLMAALRERGYGAAVPSMDWQGVKTDAAFGDCVAIAKQFPF